MRNQEVKGDNKIAEIMKEEKVITVATTEQDYDAKKNEEANNHRKLFLESVGAAIIMLGTIVVFISALLFYRQAHCGEQWSQWTPCEDVADTSTRQRCGIIETAPCMCPNSCVDIGSGIREMSQFPKIYCSKKSVYDISGEYFIRFNEQPETIAMKVCD